MYEQNNSADSRREASTKQKAEAVEGSSNDTDKPLNQENIQPQKVDINVLKARAKELQDKENFRNAIFAVLALIILASAGIYFST